MVAEKICIKLLPSYPFLLELKTHARLFGLGQKKINGVKDDGFYKGELLIALGMEKWAGRPGWITGQHG
ncbi:hypothetical protein CTI12_AA537820 [Artemisia annua]|uniref:Uncharacterized protein n=1 Tax=Artemisia annua TaxID=35608 RepID=A0A2U1L2F5_ARTAN|nr:hypothetical protein CTI12_AA537820 [Artemisia annua]